MIGKTERKQDYGETKTVYVNYLTYASQEIPQPQDFHDAGLGWPAWGAKAIQTGAARRAAPANASRVPDKPLAPA